jgi:hypothetical protein
MLFAYGLAAVSVDSERNGQRGEKVKLVPRLRRIARMAATPAGALWTTAGAALLAATAALGFTTLFSTFSALDDEGYFLITIKGYLDGAKLYDQTAGQYGPFFFEFMAAAFKLLGLHVSNDTGRLITLGLWLGAALLLAIAAYKLSRNLLLAAVVYVLAIHVLESTWAEPMHPGHLLMLLLAAMVAVAAFAGERRPRLAFVLLGMLAAMALLSKVNIGVFVFASLVFAAVLASPRLLRVRPLVAVVSAGFVLLPVVIMTGNVVKQGYIVYSAHVLIGALAVALVALGSARPHDPDSGAASWLVYAAVGAVGTAAVICGIVLAQGTSLSGLVHGVFLDALKQGALTPGPLALPANAIPYDAAGLAVAAAVALGALPSSRPWPTIGALGRIGAGLLIWAALLGSQPLALPVALVWVAAIPTRRDAKTPAARFVRLFIPALAILQVLHAYPNPGSQIWWSAFLLVVVGAVCVSDGLAELGVSALSLRLPAARLAAAGALGVAIWVGLVGLVFPLRDYQSTYRHGTPIRAWGATRIRVQPGMAQDFEWLTATLQKRCDTFITMPGLGSLYLMTQKTPPTWMNISNWMYSWDAKTQQRVVDQVKSAPRLCAVYYPGLEAFWSQGRPVPDRPLRAFILKGLQPLSSHGVFEVRVRRASAHGAG